MARTVAGRREEAAPDPSPRGLGPPYKGEDACEFCRTRTPQGVRHDLCPGEIHTTAPGRKDNKTWTCQCWKEGHRV